LPILALLALWFGALSPGSRAAEGWGGVAQAATAEAGPWDGRFGYPGTRWFGLTEPPVALAVAGDTVFVYGSGWAGGNWLRGLAMYDKARDSWSILGQLEGSSVTLRAMGAGLDDRVQSLAVGSGAKVYALGRFRSSGGVPVARIAQWTGTSWEAVGAGPEGTCSVLPTGANSLAADSHRSRLYVVGTGTAGLPESMGVWAWQEQAGCTLLANDGVARWDGRQWHAAVHQSQGVIGEVWNSDSPEYTGGVVNAVVRHAGVLCVGGKLVAYADRTQPGPSPFRIPSASIRTCTPPPTRCCAPIHWANTGCWSPA